MQVIGYWLLVRDYAFDEGFPIRFKVLMPSGMASRKEAVSATAWAISTPKKPSSQLPKKSAGMRKMPCRAIAMMTAGTVRRMFCKYMFTITTKPVSGNERHW